MSQDNWIVLTTLVAYKLVLIGVGVWASGRNRSEGDFFLAGQGLGAWVAGLSYAASTSSAWVLLGFSGFVYTSGLSALWMIPRIWGGYVAVWLFFGWRLRSETHTQGHVTPTDFMVAGQSAKARAVLSALASVMIVFCFIFYIAAQFGAAAAAFETQFGLGVTESVLIGAVVVLAYALMGGFWAVSVTDMLQGALMALVAIILPLTALVAAGGFGGIAESLQATAPQGYLDPFGGHAGFVFIGFLLGVWGVGVNAMGQPQLLSRLMAVKDEAARMRGFTIAIIWAVVVFTGMTILALAGRALVGATSDGETLFYRLAGDLLPPVLAGLVIAAVLSAVMSTVDSILLSASAAISHDLRLARRFRGREVLVSRLVMAGIAAVAVWMTLALPATIFARVLFAWSALGAAFGPIIVARVLDWEPKAWAVGTAMCLGFGLTVLFNALGALDVSGGLLDGLIRAAQWPGDPMERLFPWVPALAVLWLGRRAHEA